MLNELLYILDSGRRG